MTGDMADEMRKRAVSLIDTAIARTKELQNSAITSSEVAALLTRTHSINAVAAKS